MINTVTGKISPEELGQTLIHEHITCADWSTRMNFGKKFFDADKVAALAKRMLNDAMDCGIKTMVDGTPVNLGRDIRLIKRVSELSGMQIIASSGFYYQIEPQLAGRDEEFIYDLLYDECINGIDGTGILPGIMKAGSGTAGITPYHEKMFRATARTAVDAHLPVFCHHEVTTECGLEIADLFCGLGVKPESLILGHSGDSNDLDYLESLFKTGCYVGFDRMGYYPLSIGNALENYVKNIMHFVEKGYEKQILMSHDIAVYMAFWYTFERDLEDYENGKGLTFTMVSKDVIPALKAAGMTDEIVNTIMVENPKRLLSSCE